MAGWLFCRSRRGWLGRRADCFCELRKRFDAIGALQNVITYCGGGIAASADALVLVMLGNSDVRLYDASLSEWATDPSLPMETG
jgi:thiosulfate/3-mercaptopyruvate sulfurtransferase